MSGVDVGGPDGFFSVQKCRRLDTGDEIMLDASGAKEHVSKRVLVTHGKHILVIWYCMPAACMMLPEKCAVNAVLDV